MPTILLPLTLLSVLITTVATYVAGLFGVKLKAEGPKRLLEVLLKPRLLITAIILNVIVVAVVKYVRYARFYPERLSHIEAVQKDVGRTSYVNYADTTFSPLLVEVPSTDQPRGAVAIKVDWTTRLPKGCYENGTLSGDRLFLGSFDGHVYELDTASGNSIRRFYVGTEVDPSPTIWKNRIYTGEGAHLTLHARIYAFDLKGGNLLGAFSTEGHTEGQAVIASHEGRDLLFGVAGKDGVYALDPVAMTQVWHQAHGHVDAAVCVADRRIFAGSIEELGDTKNDVLTVSAYSFANGEVLWQNIIPASSCMAPIVNADAVYFAMGDFYKQEYYLKQTFRTIGQACKAVDEAVYLYNTRRPHRSLKLETPEQVHQKDV